MFFRFFFIFFIIFSFFKNEKNCVFSYFLIFFHIFFIYFSIKRVFHGFSVGNSSIGEEIDICQVDMRLKLHMYLPTKSHRHRPPVVQMGRNCSHTKFCLIVHWFLAPNQNCCLKIIQECHSLYFICSKLKIKRINLHLSVGSKIIDQIRYTFNIHNFP